MASTDAPFPFPVSRSLAHLGKLRHATSDGTIPVQHAIMPFAKGTALASLHDVSFLYLETDDVELADVLQNLAVFSHGPGFVLYITSLAFVSSTASPVISHIRVDLEKSDGTSKSIRLPIECTKARKLPREMEDSFAPVYCIPNVTLVYLKRFMDLENKDTLLHPTVDERTFLWTCAANHTDGYAANLGIYYDALARTTLLRAEHDINTDIMFALDSSTFENCPGNPTVQQESSRRAGHVRLRNQAALQATKLAKRPRKKVQPDSGSEYEDDEDDEKKVKSDDDYNEASDPDLEDLEISESSTTTRMQTRSSSSSSPRSARPRAARGPKPTPVSMSMAEPLPDPHYLRTPSELATHSARRPSPGKGTGLFATHALTHGTSLGHVWRHGLVLISHATLQALLVLEPTLLFMQWTGGGRSLQKYAAVIPTKMPTQRASYSLQSIDVPLMLRTGAQRTFSNVVAARFSTSPFLYRRLCDVAIQPHSATSKPAYFQMFSPPITDDMTRDGITEVMPVQTGSPVVLDRFRWFGYINHSFSPNVGVHDGQLTALRDIQLDEELSIDYGSHYWLDVLGWVSPQNGDIPPKIQTQLEHATKPFIIKALQIMADAVIDRRRALRMLICKKDLESAPGYRDFEPFLTLPYDRTTDETEILLARVPVFTTVRTVGTAPVVTCLCPRSIMATDWHERTHERIETEEGFSGQIEACIAMPGFAERVVAPTIVVEPDTVILQSKAMILSNAYGFGVDGVCLGMIKLHLPTRQCRLAHLILIGVRFLVCVLLSFLGQTRAGGTRHVPRHISLRRHA